MRSRLGAVALAIASTTVPYLAVDAGVAAAAPRLAAGRPRPGLLPAGVHLGADGRYRVDVCDHSKALFCLTEQLMPEGWAPGQTLDHPTLKPEVAGIGMAPADLLAAYRVPSSAVAGGKIVAVLDSPDSYAFQDLNAYRSAYGLPALAECSGHPTGTSPCFTQVDEMGAASSGQDSGMNDGETSLDMDMVSAACPDCTILLVEVNSLTTQDLLTGTATAIQLGAAAISISLGGPEAPDTTCGTGPGTSDPSSGYTTPGHLVIAASGDFAYQEGNDGCASPSYPASSPTVLAIGGTNLFSNGGAYDEAVWNDGDFATGQQDVTTSGCSTEFPTPPWQTAAIAGSTCTHRATADIAAAATFSSGGSTQAIAIYGTAIGGWIQVEGTSASSPIVAGLLTRLGLTDAISANLGWVYENTAAFNDLGSTAYPVDPRGSPTDSPTPSTCGSLCTAGPGWDGPSGLGTPNGTALAALATGGGSSGGSGSSSGSGGGSGSGSGGGSGSGSGGGASLDAGVPSADAGLAADLDGLDSPGGCGCRTAPAPPGQGWLVAALGALAFAPRRPRRPR